MGAAKRRQETAKQQGKPWPPTESERVVVKDKPGFYCGGCGVSVTNDVMPMVACACGRRWWRPVPTRALFR